MKVWKDIFTGDALASNEFKYTIPEEYKGACLRVSCRVLIGKDGGLAAENMTDLKQKGHKIDVVERFQLREFTMEKVDWGTYVKKYVKRVKKTLEQDNQLERITAFKEGATALAHFLIKNYNNIQLYQGRSGDPEGAFAYLYFKDPQVEESNQSLKRQKPVIMLFLDGLTTGELLVRKSMASSNQKTHGSAGSNYLMRRKLIRASQEKRAGEVNDVTKEPYICEPLENDAEDWEPYKHQFSELAQPPESQEDGQEEDDHGEGEIEDPSNGADSGENLIKKKRTKKKKKSPSKDRDRGFVLDGVRVDNQKRVGRYEQLIDVHLIRFFESKETQKNLKMTGVINKKGLLLDSARTKEIRKQEIEIKMIEEPAKQMLKKDFNLKKNLNQQLNQLAQQNLIIQPIQQPHKSLSKQQSSKYLETGYNTIEAKQMIADLMNPNISLYNNSSSNRGQNSQLLGYSNSKRNLKKNSHITLETQYEAQRPRNFNIPKTTTNNLQTMIVSPKGGGLESISELKRYDATNNLQTIQPSLNSLRPNQGAVQNLLPSIRRGEGLRKPYISQAHNMQEELNEAPTDMIMSLSQIERERKQSAHNQDFNTIDQHQQEISSYAQRLQDRATNRRLRQNISVSPAFKPGNEQHNEDQLFVIGGKNNKSRHTKNSSKQQTVQEPSQLTNKQQQEEQKMQFRVGTKTSRVTGAGGVSSKQLMRLPDIVKEISKKDKQVKTFLVNCHPYVVAPAQSTRAKSPKDSTLYITKKEKLQKQSISRK